MSRFSRLAHTGPGRRVLIVVMVALIALVAAPAATGQSPQAHARAARFVAKICPSYDPAAMDALAAVFQRTMNRRTHNGRVQIMPIQLYAASAERQPVDAPARHRRAARRMARRTQRIAIGARRARSTSGSTGRLT